MREESHVTPSSLLEQHHSLCAPIQVCSPPLALAEDGGRVRPGIAPSVSVSPPGGGRHQPGSLLLWD